MAEFITTQGKLLTLTTVWLNSVAGKHSGREDSGVQFLLITGLLGHNAAQGPRSRSQRSSTGNEFREVL